MIITYSNADGTDRVYQKSVTIEAGGDSGWGHKFYNVTPGKIYNVDVENINKVLNKEK